MIVELGRAGLLRGRALAAEAAAATAARRERQRSGGGQCERHGACAARVVMSCVSSIVGAVARVVPGPGRRGRAGPVGAAPGTRVGRSMRPCPGIAPAGAAVVEDRQHLLGHLVQRLAQAGQAEGRRRGRCRRSRRCRSRAPASGRARAATVQAPMASVSEAHATAPPGPMRVDDGRDRRGGQADVLRRAGLPVGVRDAGVGRAARQPSRPPLVTHGRPRRPAEEADPLVARPRAGAGPPWPPRRSRPRRPTT